jgi:hypothetical protein
MASSVGVPMKKFVVKKVFDESQLEDVLNNTVEEGYDVHQIFLRSFFVPSNKSRGLYYSIIFKRIDSESELPPDTN